MLCAEGRNSSSPYDAFAWFYDRYWAEPFLRWQLPALEALLFPGLKREDCVVDLCCGTGQLARVLSDKGYRVIGVDSSEEMLTLARSNVPGVMFERAEASEFTLDRLANAVVCTFDSVNHLVKPGEIGFAFQRVHAALKPGGWFVFDANTPAAYRSHWDESACHVADDHAFFLRGGYDTERRTGTTRITMFRCEETWMRSDVELQQRPLEIEEIGALLRVSGFSEFSIHDPTKDLGMKGHYGEGRVYVRACKDWKAPNGL